MGISNRARTGQGAKEAVHKFFHGERLTHPGTPMNLIQFLDNEGFIVVPKPHSAPARRGNNKKPPAYTGPDLIGKSHAARILGH